VGKGVFAVGNPHGLGWTHTEGVISQLRLQDRGGWRIRIVQTSAAVNPGNSGGGLYDKNGMLIGINTWANDRRVSEGISFAIAFDSFLALKPPQLELLRGSEDADGS
jgi:serine protease Do